MVNDLVEIRRLAKEKEAENLDFRRYLKAHHHPDLLFRKVAREIEKEIDCTKCGNCCRETTVNVSESDLAAIARYLSIPLEEAIRQYTMADADSGRTVLQTDGGCVFLDGNLCVIYEARPRACREFPHVDGDGCSLGARMSSLCNRVSFCPIVYNALECCKKLTGYR